MSDHVYPIHFQRRFEQRWAARFATTTIVRPNKPRKNGAKVPLRQTAIATNSIVKKAS